GPFVARASPQACAAAPARFPARWGFAKAKPDRMPALLHGKGIDMSLAAEPVAPATHESPRDLPGLGADPAYYNHDIAPTSPGARTWRLRDIAALWVALAACIPTYMLASSLIEEGMSCWQAILTIFLGNAIVLVPMVLNAHPGTRYGIPFPVYCRASFGLR